MSDETGKSRYDGGVINLKGKSYIEVKERVTWFRRDHPDWGIVTEAVEINHAEQFAIFRACVFNAEGRLIATATKREDVRGFADYIEKAETGSVGRALSLVGYGTLDGMDDLKNPVDAPARTDAPKLAPRPIKTPKDQVADLIKQRFGEKPIPQGIFPKVVNLLLARTIGCKDPVSADEYTRVLKAIAEEYKTGADLELLVSAAETFGGEIVADPLPNVVKSA